MTGNSTWWDRVRSYQDEYHITSYKEAETRVFHTLYERMQQDQMKQEDIRKHFEETFGLKYGAFYARVRRVL